MTTFAPAFRNGVLIGALDEWLSQRSAKPSTAVRIRQAPQRKVLKPQKWVSGFFCIIPITH